MSHKLLTQIRDNEIKNFHCQRCLISCTDDCPVLKKMQDERNLYNKETDAFIGCEFCKHLHDEISMVCEDCCHYDNTNTSKYELDKNNGE